MELAALEKQFSVVAEMEDGQTQVVSVRAERPGDAFRQVKDMPGVRRVGRVAEGRLDAPRERERAPSAPAAGRAPAPERPAVPRDVLIGRVISGPRVVIDARVTGGERPFANIPVPPERPAPPPPPPKPVAPPKVAAAPAPKPEPESPTESEAAPTAEAAPAPAGGSEYRILKSRRRDGLPYLLQRGAWRDAGGKRLFESEWEKGFATRPEAEKHLDWVKQTEQELAQFNHHVA